MKLFAVTAVAMTAAAAFAADPVPTFNRDIRPILADRCFHCHGPDANHRKAGLRLDIEDIAKEAAIVPGNPDASPLMARITSHDRNDVMPPPDSLKEAISPAEAELFRAWIAGGAIWERHWAFVPPTEPEPPAVANPDWVRNPIDAFVLARLESEGLQPSPEAERATLLRRAAFDLTGLPPTIEETEAFVNDTAPDAYEKAVDRLLASPHYGERMAMDWLDGARYADTNGYQNDFQRYMWPWRDWVINAFNENEPFDQFTIDQIAGDLVPEPTQTQRVATGFNRNNRANTEGGSIEAEWRVENIVDRIETTSAVWLGLSMGCARCHDHKYDPVSQREFYQFFAFFNSSADKGFYEETRGNAGPQVSLPSEENTARLAEFDAAIAKAQAKVDAKKQEIDAAFAKWRETYVPKAAPTAILGLPLDGTLRVSAVGALAANIPSPARKIDGEGGWSDAPLGKGVYLDGKGDSGIEIGNVPVIEWNKPFAIRCWVKPSKQGAIFSQMDEASAFRGIDTLFDENEILSVHIVHEWPGNAIKVFAEQPIPENEWTQLTLSYDGSGKAAGVTLLADGAVLPLKVESDTLSATIHTDHPFRLGRRTDNELGRITIADVRIYDQALTAEENAAITENAYAQSLRGEPAEHQLSYARAFYDKTYAPEFAAADGELAKLRADRAEYVKNEVPTVMIMEEAAEPKPTYRLVRGQYDAPDESEALNPAIPAFLPPMPQDAPANRLGLAKWLVARENPLTARVNVNRLWLKFFGTGLVKTAEDFGLQGSPPSHPELLDWLAVEFMDTGWDLKAFQKMIVTSATYRQASDVTPDLLQRDPENRLLARGPRFRLPAELIRDNALAVSGLLAEKIGGPSVMPYQPENLWADLAGGAGQGPYIQSEGEDLYRRSLYTYRKRTVPHPTMATFDAPSFELCRVRRSRTNTPLQALALLNDTTYVEAARHLAGRMLLESDGAPADRLAYGFRIVTGRTPSDSERAALVAGYDLYAATYSGNPELAAAFVQHGDSPVPDSLDPVALAPYMAVATVLLNLDETITKE